MRLGGAQPQREAMPNLLPQTAQPIDMQALYLAPPNAREAFWRRMIGGEIKAPPKTASKRMRDAVIDAVSKIASPTMANRVADVNEVLPTGMTAEAFDAGQALRQKADRSTVARAMISALGAAPVEGAAKAMFLGVMAKKADRSMLSAARDMASRGENPYSIWKKTGWFQHPVDKKWRFEISDQNANPVKVTVNRATDPNEGVASYLSEAIHHPELFANYPELKDYGVWLERPHSGGSFYGGGQNILEIASHPRHPMEAVNKSVAAHEIQHAIQDIEGFGGGAHYAEPGYNNYSGEVEARLVQSRLGLSPQERDLYFPLHHYDVPIEDQILRYPSRWRTNQ